MRDMTLRLIPFHESLAEAHFTVLQDPALYEYIGDSPPIDLAAYRVRCKKLEHTFSPDSKERWLNWAVEFEGNVVGYVQATAYDFAPDQSRAAEFAYAIHSSVWGKGVAFAACTQMLNMLRDEFQVSALWLTILKANQRSIRLAKRLGLSEIAPSHYPYTNFESGDVVMFGTL